MQNLPLIPYMEHFRSLKRAHNLGGAPHKPILLLSVAQLILSGEIADNRIRMTEELIVVFRENWQTAPARTEMKAKSFWLRVIQRVVLPSRDATVTFRQFFRCAEKS